MKLMNKKTKKDIEQVLKSIDVPEPNPIRMNEIRTELMSEDSFISSFSNLFFNLFSMQRQRYMLGVFVALMGLVLASGAFLSFNKTGKDGLSNTDKRAVFQKILDNNPQVYQTAARESIASAGGASKLSIASDRAMIYPYLPKRDYNYQVTKTVLTNGPAANQCSTLKANWYNESNEAVTTYSYEFIEDGGSYWKNVTTDSNGNVLDFYLSKYNSNQSEYYDYKGGKFAVKTISKHAQVETDAVLFDDMPEVEPEAITEPEQDIDELIKMYFGEDADIVDIVNENGKEYYVLQYSYKTNCDSMMYPAISSDMRIMPIEGDTTIISTNWVDSENFTYAKSYTYLNSVSDANLIGTVLSENETRQTSFSEVSSDFDFTYNVEVREFVFDNSNYFYDAQKEANKVNDFLNNANISFVVPVDSNRFPMPSVYVNVPYTPEPNDTVNYYLERDFYAATQAGQAQFDAATNPGLIEPSGTPFANSFGSVNLVLDKSSYSSIYLEMYKKDVSNDNLKNMLLGSEVKDLETKDVEITVDGNVVRGVEYSYSYPEFVMYETRESATGEVTTLPAIPENTKAKLVIFESADMFIVINSIPEGFNYSDLALRKLNTNDSNQLQELKNLVTESFVNPYSWE